MPASKYTHDVVASQTYQSGGEDKKSYTKVGAAFTDDQGRISIKLDYIPVHADWSGWLSLYPPKDRQGTREDQEQESGRAQQPRQQQRDYTVNRSQPRQNTQQARPAQSAPPGRQFDDGEGPLQHGNNELDDVPFAKFNEPHP